MFNIMYEEGEFSPFMSKIISDLATLPLLPYMVIPITTFVASLTTNIREFRD